MMWKSLLQDMGGFTDGLFVIYVNVPLDNRTITASVVHQLAMWK